MELNAGVWLQHVEKFDRLWTCSVDPAFWEPASTVSALALTTVLYKVPHREHEESKRNEFDLIAC